MMVGRNKGSSLVAEVLPEDSVGVELGVWKGDTSERFLATGKVKVLHMVDAWSPEPYKSVSTENYLDKYSKEVGGNTVEDFRQHDEKAFPEVWNKFVERAVIHRETTEAFFYKFSGPVDWVYVDASHEYGDVWGDLNGSLRILKPGGLIFGDDYKNPSKPGVTRAVRDFAIAHGLAIDYLGEYQFRICTQAA